jgi:hypothetical protein
VAVVLAVGARFIGQASSATWHGRARPRPGPAWTPFGR